MSEGKLTEADLRHFTGSENWYRHGLNREVLFTDGAKYVADQGGAYWLLDEIALAQRAQKAVAAEEFRVWTLTVKDDRTASLTCEDGNGDGKRYLWRDLIKLRQEQREAARRGAVSNPPCDRRFPNDRLPTTELEFNFQALLSRFCACVWSM
jgi:hypothetical protein